MGRRVKKAVYAYGAGGWELQKEILFVYDGWNLIQEKEVSGTGDPLFDKFYVWGLDLSQSIQGAGGIGGLVCRVSGGEVRHYFYDANGNVGQLVNPSDGTVTARYEFDPFGNAVSVDGADAAGNAFRFSTKYWDEETRLVYYGFRYYSSELGRWIRRDPIGEIGRKNLYLFTSNNPQNRIDLFGIDDLGPPAGPAPASEIGNCHYYIWRVLDFEKRNENTCHKPPTYYMSYGFKYCTKFSNETRPMLSDIGKEWLDRTLKLLQIYMEDQIGLDRYIEYDDTQFTQMAFNTHPDAYWNAGFHRIIPSDKLIVAATPEWREWLKDETWDQAFEMLEREVIEYYVNPSDIIKDIENQIQHAFEIYERELRRIFEYDL